MSQFRKNSLAAGVLYLVTFVSIPSFFFYSGVKSANYIIGSAPDTGTGIGAILEMIVGLACIGTALALYPVLKRQGESRALGFVASRTLECTCIFAGVAILLSVVTLRQSGGGAAALPAAHALVGLYNSTFLVSQGFIPAVNALFLGTLLYQSRLVPRVLPVVGLTGAVLLVASDVGVILGLWGQFSTIPALTTFPIAIWELSLGIYLTIKGFRPSAITALTQRRSVADKVDEESRVPAATVR
jgi:hypothetical protein